MRGAAGRIQFSSMAWHGVASADWLFESMFLFSANVIRMAPSRQENSTATGVSWRGTGSDFTPDQDAPIFAAQPFSPHLDPVMSDPSISENALKQVVKEALVEILDERRQYLRDVLEEVLQDFELIEDVREVKKASRLSGSVFALHEGEA